MVMFKEFEAIDAALDLRTRRRRALDEDMPLYKERLIPASFWDGPIDLLAGALGGVATVYTGQPLDTVKVKLQTFPHLYRNALHCTVDTFKTNGIRGLYAGTVPSLAANVGENGVLFFAYGFCQKTVKTAVGKRTVKELTDFENACAGFLAAFFSSLILCPTELVKCRLQAMQEMLEMKYGKNIPAHERVGPIMVCKHVIKVDGPTGFFRGLTSTFLREMPGYFCFFGGYEVSRTLLTPPGKTKDDLSVFRLAVAGGVGGWCLWLAIFPFDLIKSRMQVLTDSKLGFLDIFFGFLKRGVPGIREMYKGLGPTLVRTFPATGALFVTVEYTRKILHDVVDEESDEVL